MTNKHLFSQLLNKAISMALWTKAITCDKAGFKSRFCQEHQAGKNIISVNPVILSNLSSCLRALRGENLLCSYNVIARKYLRIDKALYNGRDTFIDVESSLQINPFYAKRTQFPKKPK